MNTQWTEWTGLSSRALLVVAAAVIVLATLAAYAPSRETMLILRGVAAENAPRGQLDDGAALAYARKLGYTGEVLDVASDVPTAKSQVEMALDRLRADDHVTAIYGFSGGGYNAQNIWARLSPQERQRIKKIVVVGSPGVAKGSFPQARDVVVQDDPPEGHMAGPKVLLQTAQ